jgi:hypothetical protein
MAALKWVIAAVRRGPPWRSHTPVSSRLPVCQAKGSEPPHPVLERLALDGS